jgi:hypothetical protein
VRSGATVSIDIHRRGGGLAVGGLAGASPSSRTSRAVRRGELPWPLSFDATQTLVIAIGVLFVGSIVIQCEDGQGEGREVREGEAREAPVDESAPSSPDGADVPPSGATG